MKNKIPILIIIIIVVVLGFGLFYGKDSRSFGVSGSSYVDVLLKENGCSEESAQKVNDITYECNKGEINYAQLSIYETITSDFDFNGTEEVFMLFGVNRGDTNTPLEVGIFSQKKGEFLDRFVIDERTVKITGIELDSNRRVVIDELDFKPEDDPCCPTEKGSWRASWDGDKITTRRVVE